MARKWTILIGRGMRNYSITVQPVVPWTKSESQTWRKVSNWKTIDEQLYLQEYVFTAIKRHIRHDGLYPIFGSQTQAFGTWRRLWTFNQSIWAPRAELIFFLSQSHRRVSIPQKVLTHAHPSNLTWNNILNDPNPWSRQILARTPPLGQGALTLLTNTPYILCASFCEKKFRTGWPLECGVLRLEKRIIQLRVEISFLPASFEREHLGCALLVFSGSSAFLPSFPLGEARLYTRLFSKEWNWARGEQPLPIRAIFKYQYSVW